METTYTQVPVLINFFNRPEPLKKVFAAVRSAKPKYLFLSQDGPRAGNATDAEKIAACRDVVSQIDWDCQVYHNYSEVNLGCGKRMSSAITWAFSYVDRLMILEDDCVGAKHILAHLLGGLSAQELHVFFHIQILHQSG